MIGYNVVKSEHDFANCIERNKYMYNKTYLKVEIEIFVMYHVRMCYSLWLILINQIEEVILQMNWLPFIF